MADPRTRTDNFRRWARRRYLTKHEQQRRAKAKAEGARRIDVTLNAKALDDYATVRRYIEGLNRWFAEHNLRLSDTESAKVPAIRLSDTEIITMALDLAAAAIREDEDQAAKAGLRRLLVE
jgi:hypothetical protein